MATRLFVLDDRTRDLPVVKCQGDQVDFDPPPIAECERFERGRRRGLDVFVERFAKLSRRTLSRGGVLNRRIPSLSSACAASLLFLGMTLSTSPLLNTVRYITTWA